MDDIIVWIIIVAFYAPLHFLLPTLFLFITGSESNEVRRQLMRKALIDSALSMVAAFVVVILLVQADRIPLAMLVLLLSMAIPFIRIWRCRRTIAGDVPAD